MATKKKSTKKKSSGSKKKAVPKKKAAKKQPRCAATMKDPKTGRKRRCKNKATGKSKFCASHKK